MIESTHPVVGKIGHFSLTSFRKYLPLPDGGLVNNNTEYTLAYLPPTLSEFVRYRLLGKLLRYEFIHDNLNSPKLEELYLNLFATAEKELDAQTPMQGMSKISQDLLKRLNLSNAMEKRRSNFLFILQAFAEIPKLQSIGIPLITELPEEVSPLAFPIRVRTEKREQVRSELQSQKVFCPIHWHLPQAVQETQFPEAYQISKEILSLPIDQRYNNNDMNCLIDQLLAASQNL
ncbi:DegT/DnrJ/EryC1/StrS family aminotransferase [Nostoc sp.]|uniref:DegT/DnrJ/EryC1/StrS family aminotransferase n=1 Tax=Nostoc sp. TaxID=1180 RepID=UPI002FF64439